MRAEGIQVPPSPLVVNQLTSNPPHFVPGLEDRPFTDLYLRTGILQYLIGPGASPLQPYLEVFKNDRALQNRTAGARCRDN